MHNFLLPSHHGSVTLLQLKRFRYGGFGLRDASDEEIFFAARAANAVVMTKDQDFVQLLDKLGPPPKVIWVTCGNISNRQMQYILHQNFQYARSRLQAGTPLVEIPNIII